MGKKPKTPIEKKLEEILEAMRKDKSLSRNNTKDYRFIKRAVVTAILEGYKNNVSAKESKAKKRDCQISTAFLIKRVLELTESTPLKKDNERFRRRIYKTSLWLNDKGFDDLFFSHKGTQVLIVYGRKEIIDEIEKKHKGKKRPSGEERKILERLKKAPIDDNEPPQLPHTITPYTISSVFTFDEFLKRNETKRLFNFNKFIGREEEFSMLQHFLRSSQQVLHIVGSGGIGKTRLLIEFTKKIRHTQNVFFVNNNSAFQLNPSYEENTSLFIIDEAMRYPCIDKFLEFISENKKVKLILLDRHATQDFISNKLRINGFNTNPYKLPPGNISEFLKHYFEIEDNSTLKEIVSKAKNSFIWAAFIAEEYKNHHKVHNLTKTIELRSEKYLTDLSTRTEINIPDLRTCIYLISLLQPIRWDKDRYYFETALPKYYFHNLERLIDTVWNSTDIITSSNNCYIISPDSLGDTFRSELVSRKEFDRLIMLFFKKFPYSITVNIASLSEGKEILPELWNRLNSDSFLDSSFLEAYHWMIGTFGSSLSAGTNISHLFKQISNLLKRSTHISSADEYIYRCINDLAYILKDVNDGEALKILIKEAKSLQNKYSNNYWIENALSGGLSAHISFALNNKKFMLGHKLLSDYKKRILKQPHPSKSAIYCWAASNIISNLIQQTTTDKIDKYILEIIDVVNNSPTNIESIRSITEVFNGAIRESSIKLDIALTDYYLSKLKALYMGCKKEKHLLCIDYALGLVSATRGFETKSLVDNTDICKKKSDEYLLELTSLYKKNKTNEMGLQLSKAYFVKTMYFSDPTRAHSALYHIKQLLKKHPQKEIATIFAYAMGNFSSRISNMEMHEKFLFEIHRLAEKYSPEDVEEGLVLVTVALINANKVIGDHKKIKELIQTLNTYSTKYTRINLFEDNPEINLSRNIFSL